MYSQVVFCVDLGSVYSHGVLPRGLCVVSFLSCLSVCLCKYVTRSAYLVKTAARSYPQSFRRRYLGRGSAAWNGDDMRPAGKAFWCDVLTLFLSFHRAVVLTAWCVVLVLGTSCRAWLPSSFPPGASRFLVSFACLLFHAQQVPTECANDIFATTFSHTDFSSPPCLAKVPKLTRTPT